MEFPRRGFSTIGFKGGFTLRLFDDKHILIRFSLPEDYHRCWRRGSWNFKQHVKKVLKWSPNFKPDQEPPIAPVWLSFNHLSLHLFQKKPLLSLTSLIGRPLKIDAETQPLVRPSVACVCVEVNLLRPLLRRIWIGQGDDGFWQPMVYENLPSNCEDCA